MNPALTHIHDTLHAIKSGIQKEIIGQDALIDKLIITFFAGGHALLEWVPGLGKTKTIRTFARVLGLDTGRVSFTPDLLPSDLTGSEIYRQGKGTFEVRKGPIFTSILLADEINRTPPKVQSALLEAMEEKKVTIGDKTLDLPSPFVVFATQNPLEHEGTYPLPEAHRPRISNSNRWKADTDARDRDAYGRTRRQSDTHSYRSPRDDRLHSKKYTGRWEDIWLCRGSTLISQASHKVIREYQNPTPRLRPIYSCRTRPHPYESYPCTHGVTWLRDDRGYQVPRSRYHRPPHRTLIRGECRVTHSISDNCSCTRRGESTIKKSPSELEGDFLLWPLW